MTSIPQPVPQDEQLALLKRFEPIMRFTKGEHFFPTAVDDYVAHCSLWRQLPGREAECIVPADKLTLNELGQFSDIDKISGRQGVVYFLKFVDPLTVVEMASHTRQQRAVDKLEKNVFRPGPGRLARVGYFSRLVDALFSLTLLARGRVSGDTSAAASIFYDQTYQRNPHYRYHGRVVRQGDWLVLQYWYFYYFNNWRSGFFGANDHEGDWEMVCLYLSQDESQDEQNQLTPEWVAYASHDYTGDDLRRHWDDPELERIGEHPIIYAGAGSHASYYAPGEYVTELTLPFLRPVVRLADRLKRIWRTQLRQYTQISDEDEQGGESLSIFQIPFVDYARGDGIHIGPHETYQWDEPILLNPAPPWVLNYRGLWGLYTQDPLSGEDAPAGPMYDRDGSVRRAWYDPVGWAGLDKVPPLNQALDVVQGQIARLEAEQSELSETTAVQDTLLRGLGVEIQAINNHPDLYGITQNYDDSLQKLTTELHTLRERMAHNDMVLRALHAQAEQLANGHRPPLRAHIKHAHRPATSAEIKTSRITEIWAAMSIGVLLFGIVLLIFFARNFLLVGTMALIFTISLIEAAFRRRLINFLNNTAIFLAVVASLILLYEFFLEWLVMGVLLAGLYILFINIRELRA